MSAIDGNSKPDWEAESSSEINGNVARADRAGRVRENA